VVKKAITCEESNAGKHSGPNIITRTGNLPHYFGLRPGLVSPASMGSTELQPVLHQPLACSLQLGFANQHSGRPFFTFSASLPPCPLAVHHPSCGGSTVTPLPLFLLHSSLCLLHSVLCSTLSLSPWLCIKDITVRNEAVMVFFPFGSS